jgi:hypothetical protein
MTLFHLKIPSTTQKLAQEENLSPIPCFTNVWIPIFPNAQIKTNYNSHLRVPTSIHTLLQSQNLFPRSRYLKHSYSWDNVISRLFKNPLNFASFSTTSHPNNQNLNSPMQWKFGNHHKHSFYECTKNASNPLKTITKLENNKSKLIQIHSFTPKHQKMVFLEQTSDPYNWSPTHFLSTQNLPNQSMPQLLNTLWITRK